MPLTASELINVNVKTEPDTDVYNTALALLDKLFEGTSLTLGRAVELGKHNEHTRQEPKELSADSVVQRIVDNPARGCASGFSACYRCG